MYAFGDVRTLYKKGGLASSFFSCACLGRWAWARAFETLGRGRPYPKNPSLPSSLPPPCCGASPSRPDRGCSPQYKALTHPTTPHNTHRTHANSNAKRHTHITTHILQPTHRRCRCAATRRLSIVGPLRGPRYEQIRVVYTPHTSRTAWGPLRDGVRTNTCGLRPAYLPNGAGTPTGSNIA